MITSRKNRIGSWDIARAAAVFLVVLGHGLQGRGMLCHMIYSFHVPALVFISGLSFSAGARGYGAFLKKTARRVLVPYALFGLISILIFMLVGQQAAASLGVRDGVSDFGFRANFLGLLWGNPLSGHMKWNLPLWYLPCLFLMMQGHYLMNSLFIRRNRGLWALAVTAVLITGNHLFLRFWNGPFCLETAVNLYPFYWAGAMLRKKGLYRENSSLPRWKPLLGGAVLLALGMGLSLLNSRILYTEDFYGRILLFYFCALLGTGGLMGLCQGLRRCAPLEYMGRHTMTVLCLHKFPLVLFQMALPQWMASAPWVIFFSVLTCLLCLLADWIIRRAFPFLLGGWYPKRDKLT